LRNIIDPSAEVGREYLLTTVRLTDGRVVSGMVTEENNLSITLGNGIDEVVVSRADIKRNDEGNLLVERSSTSMMPAGQLLALTVDQVRDLIAYLGSPSQVALPTDSLQ
jgi:putative heme-binding domain-containing protein